MANNTTEEVKELNVDALGGLLLGYVLMGLPAFIGVFWFYDKGFKAFKESMVFFFSCHRGSLRGAQNIHGALLALLLMDVLMAVASVILAIEFFTAPCNPAFACVSVFNTFTVWSLYRCFGMVLHLLCTLVAIIFLCNPQQAAKLRWAVTVVPLLISVFVPVYIYISHVVTLGLGILIFGLTVAIIAHWRVRAPCPIADCQKTGLVNGAVYTLFMVYVPIFVLQCLMLSSDNYGEPDNKYFTHYVVILTATSYQLFMDGRFCGSILELTPGDEEEEEVREAQQQSWGNTNFGFSEMSSKHNVQTSNFVWST